MSSLHEQIDIFPEKTLGIPRTTYSAIEEAGWNADYWYVEITFDLFLEEAVEDCI